MAFTPGAFAAENEGGTAADLVIQASALFQAVGAFNPSYLSVISAASFSAVSASVVNSALSIPAVANLQNISAANSGTFSIAATAVLSQITASSVKSVFTIQSNGLLFLTYPNATNIGNLSLTSQSTMTIFAKSKMVDKRTMLT